MTLAADLAAVLAETLALLVDLGLADTTTLTSASGGASATAYALDATEATGAFDPSGAATAAPASGFVVARRRRLFVAPRTTAGAALPFEPAPGDLATWAGQTVGVLGVTPVRPGAVMLGAFVDVEA